MKDQSDQIILETLQDSRRMLAGVLGAVLFTVGIALLLSPLFLASQSYVWVLGVAILAVLCIYGRTKEAPMKSKNKACYMASMLLQCAALILEILPLGVVMIFATRPDQRVTVLYSYFSLLPLVYANVAPMLTGLLTIAILLLGGVAVLRFDKASKLRRAVLLCSVISFLLSIFPLFLLGAPGMTAASYAVSGAILLSTCLQAAARRKA